MLVPDTRISLLQRLHDRDDSTAWVEFCEIYERTIYRLALKYGLQDADAREVSRSVAVFICSTSRDEEPFGLGWPPSRGTQPSINCVRIADGPRSIFRKSLY